MAAEPHVPLITPHPCLSGATVLSGQRSGRINFDPHGISSSVLLADRLPSSVADIPRGQLSGVTGMVDGFQTSRIMLCRRPLRREVSFRNNVNQQAGLAGQDITAQPTPLATCRVRPYLGPLPLTTRAERRGLI